MDLLDGGWNHPARVSPDVSRPDPRCASDLSSEVHIRAQRSNHVNSNLKSFIQESPPKNPRQSRDHPVFSPRCLILEAVTGADAADDESVLRSDFALPWIEMEDDAHPRPVRVVNPRYGLPSFRADCAAFPDFSVPPAGEPATVGSVVPALELGHPAPTPGRGAGECPPASRGRTTPSLFGLRTGRCGLAGRGVGGLDDLVRLAYLQVLEMADRPRGPADGQPRHFLGAADADQEPGVVG